MPCDMCGKDSRLLVALVEGVEMHVCSECSKYGKVMRRQAKPVFVKKKEKKPEKEELQLIVSDYDKIVRKARERLGLNQKEFANKLSEKESIIQKIETREFKPSIALAEKLEKILNVKLVETVEVEKEKKEKKSGSAGMTIGDLIKLK